MPRATRHSKLQAFCLLLCLGLPSPYQLHPDVLALLIVSFAAVLHWSATVRSDDPFLSTARVGWLWTLVYANAIAYSLSHLPNVPYPNWTTAVLLPVYLLVLFKLIIRSSQRVARIDREYFQYSLPSKRLTVDQGRRSGRLNQAQAALRLQLFVKEGLQFRRLSQVCRLLVLQTWGGLALFLVFGLQEPWYLLLFLLNSVLIAASASSIASRATLHPGEQLDEMPSPEDDDFQDFWG